MRFNPSLEAFENELRKYMDLENEIIHVPPKHLIGCIALESSPVKDSLRSEAVAWRFQFAHNLHEQARDETEQFRSEMIDSCSRLERNVNDLDDVRDMMAVLKGVREREAEIDFIVCPIEDRYALLKRQASLRIPSLPPQHLHRHAYIHTNLSCVVHEVYQTQTDHNAIYQIYTHIHASAAPQEAAKPTILTHPPQHTHTHT